MLLRHKRQKFYDVKFRLEVYLENKRQPIIMLVDTENQIDQFFAKLSAPVDADNQGNSFFKFGQLIFNRKLVRYAVFEEVEKKVQKSY